MLFVYNNKQVLCISLDKFRLITFNPILKMKLNSIVHALFGFVICLKIYEYNSILKEKLFLNFLEIKKIVMLFSIFGFSNEFFQNWYQHQTILQLMFDSKKYILMNIIGSIIFITMYQKIQKIILKNNIKNI